ncbi:hypothetical protein Tco_0624905 [Tanacetum coccineum]|uniref:Reverse transcriptase domain-containing protein n=1 Tax=Tanacetum coccineum TaxID=301880 RepID=A0ABQ4WF89_9ASTR
MEWEIKRLKRSQIPLVKVRWNSRRGPEFTWECEDSFKQKYPQLFTNRASSSTTSNALGYSTFRCNPDLGVLHVMPLIPTFIASGGSLIVSSSRTPTILGQMTNSLAVCALYSALAIVMKLALVAQW